MTETEELAKLRGENSVLLCLLTKCANALRDVEPGDTHEAECMGDLIHAIDNVLNPEGDVLL